MMSSGRLKQLLAAGVIVAAASGVLTLALVRALSTAALFTRGSRGPESDRLLSASPPLNNGCPRGDHASKRDLTIHFVFGLPFAHFDGQIEIKDQAYATIYRGPYRSTIMLEGLCYDADRRGGDETSLYVELITRHHRYSFHGPVKLSAHTYSEVEISLGLDAHGNYREASIRPIR